MGGFRLNGGARRCQTVLLIMVVALIAGGNSFAARAIDLSALLTTDIAGDNWMASRADTFAGVDATDSSVFTYGGFTLAPSGLDHDGLRLRFFAGAGYHGLEEPGRASAVVPEGFTHRADIFQAETLVGWQVSSGPVIAKLFAGASYEEQAVTGPEIDYALAGEHLGAKVALETWVDLSRSVWLSADASYATGIGAYSAALRLGVRPAAWMSVGPEAAVFGDREHDGQRLGAFARWHCGSCDATLSGGVSGDYAEETGAYGALSFYRRF